MSTTSNASKPSITELRQRLAAAGQEQVLRHYDGLPPQGKAKLEAQLAALDLASLDRLPDEYVRRKPEIHLPKEIKPVKTYPRVPAGTEQAKMYEGAAQRGRELLKSGKIGAFLVAGGQG